MKRIISIALAVVMAFTVLPLNAFATTIVASGLCGSNDDYSWTVDDNLTWTLDSNGLLTIQGSGKMFGSNDGGNIPWHAYTTQIRTVYISYGVTTIGSMAFSMCKNLVDVTIPDSVTVIGGTAFSNCSSLTEITIPDSVTTIVRSAFSNCSSLQSITIPRSVSEIGSFAFSQCDSLSEVFIPNSVISLGSYAFSQCDDLRKVVFEEGVLEVPNYAFNGCVNLTDVYLPNSLTKIGKEAFRNCESISTIDIPSNVTYIDEYAFGYCSNLTSIVIPDSVNYVGSSAFISCTSLESAILSNNMTEINQSTFKSCSKLSEISLPSNVAEIGTSSFRGCSSLTSINIPDSVTSIGNEAFYNCSSLTRITIGNGVTSIGDWTFSGCSNLTSITIPDGVTSIGNYAFYCCSNLTSITIPDGVTSIGNSAFEGCSSLTNIIIPNSIINIGGAAFNNCSSLTGVSIPDSVTSIDNYAFGGCSSLTSIAIPDCVTSIGYYAFSNCSNLTSVTIGNGVTSIGDSAFRSCSSLTSVTIPDSVTSIDNYAFGGCSSLTSIAIPDCVTSIGYYAFSNCSNLTNVTIGDSITSIGGYAFRGCTSLTSVIIPDSVTSIGSYAFYGCSSLKSITFLNYDTEIYDSSATIDKFATIYGYAGSTAQAYAEKYDRKFVELYTADVLDIPSGKFGVYVVDSSSLPVEGANVIATSRGITNSGITGENGLALVDTVLYDEVQLKVTKEGYQSVTVDRVVKSGDVAVVTVNVDDGKPHVFAVNATLGNEKFDLMHDKKYFKSNSEGIDSADDLSNVKDMVITVEASASEQIDCYQLIQGGKVVAQSNISTFYIPVYTGTPDFPDRYINDCRIDTFSAGKDVYLRIVDINGEVSGETKLGLVISKPFTYQDNSGGKLTFGKKFKLSVPSDIPIIGGDEIELGWEGLPFEFEVFEDGKVKFAVNIPVKNDESGFIEGTEMLDWDDIEDVYMNALSGKPAKGTLPQKFGAGVVKLDANIIGYGEGYVDDYGNIVVNVGLVVSVYQDASYTWTYFIGHVPVYIAVGEKLGFTGSGEFSIVNTNGNWEFTGAVGEINPKFSFNVDGGVGANGVLSVGASGKGTLSWLHRLSDNYENVSLTAELKVIATAFLFKYEKHLWERTWTLYDSNSARTTMTAELFYSGLYSEGAYKTISRDYLYSPAPLSFNEDTVKSNVFPYTTPELIKIGDLSYLFWLDDIAERADNDRTALVYAVSSDNCKTWSEPAQVIPEEIDGAAAFDYDICVDGTDIHIVLSRANRVFGDEESDLNTMAAASEIYYIKLSTIDNSITLPVQITNNVYADTMPAIVSYGGETVVAFTENRLEDGLFGTRNTYNVCTSVVGTESINTSEINGLVTELSAGVVDEKITIAYIVDTDYNFSTDDDTELWTLSAQQSIKLNNGDSRIYSPTFAKIGVNDALLWYSNGNIYYSININETTESVFTNTIPVTLSRKFFVINGISGQTKIIWNSIDPDSESNEIQIYATAYNDNGWTDVYKVLNTDSDLTSSLSGYCEEDSDYITYVDVENASEVLTASLNVNTVLPSTDIAVVDVEYDYENVHLGELLPLTVTVKNCGSTSISDFSIIINGTTPYQITNASLSVGETNAFDVTGFVVPEVLASAQSFNVTVTTLNDIQFDNNSLDIVVGYTDLSIGTSKKLINNEEWISVSVFNLSEVGSNAYLTITADGKDGLVLYNERLINVTSDASQLVMINLDMLRRIKETDIFYVSVMSDNAEISLSDNTEMLYLGLDNNADYTSGDINGDDSVDKNDAIYLLYSVLFGESQYPLNQTCDFNADGYVDKNDAIYLLYHALFGETNYPLN